MKCLFKYRNSPARERLLSKWIAITVEETKRFIAVLLFVGVLGFKSWRHLFSSPGNLAKRIFFFFFLIIQTKDLSQPEMFGSKKNPIEKSEFFSSRRKKSREAPWFFFKGKFQRVRSRSPETLPKEPTFGVV